MSKHRESQSSQAKRVDRVFADVGHRCDGVFFPAMTRNSRPALVAWTPWATRLRGTAESPRLVLEDSLLLASVQIDSSEHRCSLSRVKARKS